MAPLYFFNFSKTQKDYTGPDSIVDVCLHAMEEGKLSVIAKQTGYYLWEVYVLTVDQWVRMCALLQRNWLPSSLFWVFGTSVDWTKRGAFAEPSLVSEDPDAVAALSRIEFLWQDLNAVDAWVHSMPRGYCDVEWVAAEVARRRQWFTGLRRAWVLAVITDSCS